MHANEYGRDRSVDGNSKILHHALHRANGSLRFAPHRSHDGREIGWHENARPRTVHEEQTGQEQRRPRDSHLAENAIRNEHDGKTCYTIVQKSCVIANHLPQLVMLICRRKLYAANGFTKFHRRIGEWNLIKDGPLLASIIHSVENKFDYVDAVADEPLFLELIPLYSFPLSTPPVYSVLKEAIVQRMNLINQFIQFEQDVSDKLRKLKLKFTEMFPDIDDSNYAHNESPVDLDYIFTFARFDDLLAGERHGAAS